MVCHYPVCTEAPLDSVIRCWAWCVNVFRASRSQLVAGAVCHENRQNNNCLIWGQTDISGIQLNLTLRILFPVFVVWQANNGELSTWALIERRNAVSIVVALCCSVHRIRTTACFCGRPHSEDWRKRKKDSRELKVDVFISVLWSEVIHSRKLPDHVKLIILPCLVIRDSDVTGTRHWTYCKNYRIHMDIRPSDSRQGHRIRHDGKGTNSGTIALDYQNTVLLSYSRYFYMPTHSRWGN